MNLRKTAQKRHHSYSANHLMVMTLNTCRPNFEAKLHELSHNAGLVYLACLSRVPKSHEAGFFVIPSHELANCWPQPALAEVTSSLPFKSIVERLVHEVRREIFLLTLLFYSLLFSFLLLSFFLLFEKGEDKISSWEFVVWRRKCCQLFSRGIQIRLLCFVIIKKFLRFF